MANVVSELKQAVGPGARPSKYKILMNMPTASGGTGGKIINTLCNAQSFPGVSQGPIEIYTQGRKLVLPGDTEYETTWTVTFYQTEDHKLRRDFLKWMKVMDDFQENKHQGNLAELMVEQTIIQLNHNEEEVASYRFEGLFPQNIGPVEVSDSEQNTISNFDVTFSFTSWVVVEDE